jgi:DNA-binding transcriptional LysR family regulator
MPRLDRLPLEAFRVFEAAARHRNFSAAARELKVTQGAVSRRVQGLEADLGAALFLRRGRRLALTDRGEALARRTRAALDFLAEGLEAFEPAAGAETVALAASGSVSHFWLGPRLRAFAAAHPAASIRLLTTDAMAELAAETHDVVVLSGRGEHPRWRLTEVAPETLAPVAAPGWLAARGLAPGPLPAATLAGLDLIDYEPFNAHWLTLGDWFEWAGAPRPRRPRLTVSTYATAVEAAIRGEGVALGSLAILGDAIARGDLAVVSDRVWRTGAGYHAGLPRARPPSAVAEALHAALTGAAS